MTTSLQIGLIAAFASGLLAMLTASLCAINKTLDYIIRGLIDSMLALPHLLLLVLICFTLILMKILMFLVMVIKIIPLHFSLKLKFYCREK